jgi:chemotaxis protein CheX
MERLEEQICQVTGAVWRVVLGLAVQPTSEVPAAAERFLLGSVAVTGAWHGAVWLYCSPALARQAAAIMFAVEPTQATEDQIRDALGELTNIAGGNLKALFPGPCSLSVPTVTERDRCDLPEGRLLARVAFDCQGEPLLVACVERDVADEKEVGSRSDR